MTDEQQERFQEVMSQINDIREADALATQHILEMLIVAFTALNPQAAKPLTGMLIAAGQDGEQHLPDTDAARGAYRGRISSALNMIQG
jgi:hypothetical protein